MKIEKFKAIFKSLTPEEQAHTISEMKRTKEYLDTEYEEAFQKLLAWCVKNKTQ